MSCWTVSWTSFKTSTDRLLLPNIPTLSFLELPWLCLLCHSGVRRKAGSTFQPPRERSICNIHRAFDRTLPLFGLFHFITLRFMLPLMPIMFQVLSSALLQYHHVYELLDNVLVGDSVGWSNCTPADPGKQIFLRQPIFFKQDIFYKGRSSIYHIYHSVILKLELIASEFILVTN